MKKYQLKETPTKILILIEMLICFFFGADCEDTNIFIISKIINIVLFVALAKIISKYGNKKIIK